ncbi:MAG: hypothetical protein HY318_09640 [Armatimonadetes bacterium]|nr:hypothetical protein [Armatimonadota bacterium]
MQFSSEPKGPDPIDALIDRVAEAVVRKIEEQQKIDAIAQAVLERLEASVKRTAQSAGRKTARPTPPKPISQKPKPKTPPTVASNRGGNTKGGTQSRQTVTQPRSRKT